MNPPPLPGSNRAPGANAFPLHAANACLAAPLLIFGFSVAISLVSVGHHSSPDRLMMLTLDVLAVGGMVTGTVLGIVAMTLAPAGQRASVFVRASAGLLLTALLLAIAVPNFIHARALAQQNRQAFLQMHAASETLNSQVVDSLRDPRKHQVDLARFENSLNQAAGQSHGSAALALRASSSYVGQLQSHKSSYEQASRELLSADVLTATNLTEREQIQERKAVVEKFLEANKGLKEFAAQGESKFRQALVDSGVSSELIETAVAGFDKKFIPQLPFVTKMRDTDERIGQAMLGFLDLLDTHWGRWRYDQRIGQLHFDDQAAVGEYNAFLDSITQARDEQRAAQKGLAAVLSAGASAQQAQQ